jgi:hypothetical protein
LELYEKFSFLCLLPARFNKGEFPDPHNLPWVCVGQRNLTSYPR